MKKEWIYRFALTGTTKQIDDDEIGRKIFFLKFNMLKIQSEIVFFVFLFVEI